MRRLGLRISFGAFVGRRVLIGSVFFLDGALEEPGFLLRYDALGGSGFLLSTGALCDLWVSSALWRAYLPRISCSAMVRWPLLDFSKTMARSKDMGFFYSLARYHIAGFWHLVARFFSLGFLNSLARLKVLGFFLPLARLTVVDFLWTSGALVFHGFLASCGALTVHGFHTGNGALD